MAYIANTEEQQQAMLAEAGFSSVADLFSALPDDLKSEPDAGIPSGKSELEVRKHLQGLAGNGAADLTCFLGGGFYDHFIPAAVDAAISRSEFFTAYTPYQPEISQGTLQAIFEYQSAICRLTGMDVSNASLYDGGTALYEAVMMATVITGRRRIIIDEAVNPIYRKILRSYTSNLSLEFVEIPSGEGVSDRAAIEAALNDSTAALILQNPNFFGCIDDFSDLVEKAHSHSALALCSVYPVSLGMLKTPGDMGFDIVTGEGQSMGLPLSFGGPYLGFMAVRKKYVRKMPGRVAGRTCDARGRDGFVLTLQAREQHIRRQKAVSNVCTNEALCALAALAYLTLAGKQGMPEIAQLCADKAAYACERFSGIPGVSRKFKAPFFNEFVIDIGRDAGEVIGQLVEKGFAAGFPLSRYYQNMENCMLVAVTEKRTKEEIGRLCEALEGVL